jgi:abortive infection bacteriophage resistance protein
MGNAHNVYVSEHSEFFAISSQNTALLPQIYILCSFNHIAHIYSLYCIMEKAPVCKDYGGNHVLQNKWLHVTICSWLQSISNRLLHQ